MHPEWQIPICPPYTQSNHLTLRPASLPPSTRLSSERKPPVDDFCRLALTHRLGQRNAIDRGTVSYTPRSLVRNTGAYRPVSKAFGSMYSHSATRNTPELKLSRMYGFRWCPGCWRYKPVGKRVLVKPLPPR